MDTENKSFTSDKNDRGNQDNPYEICVCCHKKVKVSRNEEIAFRSFYIEGAGQLCYDCFHELYPEHKGC